MDSRKPRESIQLLKSLPRNPIKMLKIQSTLDRQPIDHPNNYKILKAAIKMNLPIFVHCSKTDPGASPILLAKLVQRFPDVRIIIGHMGGALRKHNEKAIEIARKNENLFFDTSASQHEGTIERTVEEIGEDRLLFGSDLPVLSFEEQYLAIENAEISKKAKRRILRDNILRVLRL